MNSPGRLINNQVRDELIAKYFTEGYTYEEITTLLQHRHGFSISVRQLIRVLQKYGLKRRGIERHSMEEIAAAIIVELDGSGSCLGYKSLWQRLKQEYGLNVERDAVLEILRIADPEGISTRTRNKFRRRRYVVPGPNFIWHVDGYDKLKPFGFAIHGCIDGYSRKILWLEVASSNNNPRIIASYYLKAIQRFNLLPTLIRSDLGTENCMIQSLQIALRLDHNDQLAGYKSFIKGKSTSNQRIEAYWGQMRKHGGDFYISFFKDMRDAGIFNDADPLHIECLRYCFGPLIRNDLIIIKNEWNRHRIRNQKNTELPAGKPNHLFYAPQKYGGEDYKKEVEKECLDDLMPEYSSDPVLIDPLFCELVELLGLDTPALELVDDALKLYICIMDLIVNIEEN